MLLPNCSLYSLFQYSNCSKEFYDKVNIILKENEKNNKNLKVPIRIKNTIQAEINSPKKEKSKSLNLKKNIQKKI